MSNIETMYRVIAICLCCAGISVEISRQIKLISHWSETRKTTCGSFGCCNFIESSIIIEYDA